MKVTAVTPVPAAASPDHHDHARWVKEKTLAMEVEHARRIGLTTRHAEAENTRLLERMDALARLEKAPIARSASVAPAKRKTREQRIIDRAVTIVAAQPQVRNQKLSPCGRCGTCRRCMRERRILAIINKAKQGDRFMLGLAWEVTATTLDAKGGVGRFRTMSPMDANRIVIRKAEDVCDRSVPKMGPWR